MISLRKWVALLSVLCLLVMLTALTTGMLSCSQPKPAPGGGDGDGDGDGGGGDGDGDGDVSSVYIDRTGTAVTLIC